MLAENAVQVLFFSIHFCKCIVNIPGRRQSKTLLWIKNSNKQCFRLPFVAVWRQMAIENSVSNDFYLRSSIVLLFSICRIPGVVNGRSKHRYVHFKLKKHLPNNNL